MTTTRRAVAARLLDADRAFRAPPDPETRTGFTPHLRPPAPIVGSVSFITLKRVGIGVGATLAVLVLITTAVVGVAWSQVPRDQLAVTQPGGFTADSAATGDYPLGGDTLVVVDNQVRLESPGGTIWASSPGVAFLAAASGDVDWQEHRGYFWPDVAHSATWDAQRLTDVEASPDSLTLTGVLTGDAAGELPYVVSFAPQPEGGVSVDVGVGSGSPEGDDEAATRPDVIHWTSARTEGAGVHGFGEQYDDFDLDGRLIPIVVREQGVGRGEQPLTFLANVTNHGAGGTHAMTYATWPTYVTDDLQGLRLDPRVESSSSFAIADTREPGQVGLDVWSPEMRIQLTRADTPVELLQKQHAGVDRPPLAGWTQEGAIVGIQGGTESVRSVVDDLERAGTEVAGVWLQDWTGRRTTDFG